MGYPGFSLVCLNTFGIPFFLSWSRLSRLARQLEHLGPTIICLQEIQQNGYIPLLIRSLANYPHHVLFPHVYAPKGGLGLFSRVPILTSRFDVYPDRGLRYLVTFSDWGLYKGVLITHLRINGREIVVLNTHLNANYLGVWSLRNPLVRVQRRQLSKLKTVVGDLTPDKVVVLCGDLNFPRGTFLYDELLAGTGLVDALAGNPKPTYRPFPLVPSQWKTSLDYMLCRVPDGAEFDIRADVLPIEDSGQKTSAGRFLTDHNALTLRMHWT